MTDSENRAPGMKRSLRVLLFVSLALNLLVVGLMLGAAVSHWGEERRHPSHMSHPGGPLTAALDGKDRRDVGRQLRRAMRTERAANGDTGAAYGGVIAALTAQPYDPAAMRSAVMTQMQQVTRRVELGVDILVERFDAMSAAERAAYAERLQEVLHHATRRPPKGARGGLLQLHAPHD